MSLCVCVFASLNLEPCRVYSRTSGKKIYAVMMHSISVQHGSVAVDPSSSMVLILACADRTFRRASADGLNIEIHTNGYTDGQQSELHSSLDTTRLQRIFSVPPRVIGHYWCSAAASVPSEPVTGRVP